MGINYGGREKIKFALFGVSISQWTEKVRISRGKIFMS